jgi:general stress protein YciG
MNASTETARESTPEQHAPSHTGAQHHVSEQAPESVTTESAESTTDAPRVRKPRGFAAMDRSLVSAIARKGGKAAHEAGTAHEFTREEAREAGRKGGQATHAKRRAKTDEPAS